MSSVAHLSIHSSQYPTRVGLDLIESLRTRKVNHKFHYDSPRQAQKWLALHQAYSPSRTDPDCAATYDRCFEAVATTLTSRSIHLLGLGCGSGQKDERVLNLLRNSGNHLSYTPSDVSTAMVLLARKQVESIVPIDRCFPFVCDLNSVEDPCGALEEHLKSSAPEVCRVITFFGMLPNFEPEIVLPRLAKLVQANDLLLLSANLAPGLDYSAGIRRVLPLYDNELTRDWLLTFLLDLGFERSDGVIQFQIQPHEIFSGLSRISADFKFCRSRQVRINEEQFDFVPGDSLRLFFSYRHTPDLVQTLLAHQNLRVVSQWITRSEEEGVFLVRKQAP